MPEGPEILLFKYYLDEKILNKFIINIISISKKKVIIPEKAKINGVGAKGKLLWLETKNYYIHILLKISGWISNENLKNPKYILIFDDGTKIYIDDPRKLCTINIITKSNHNKVLEMLGLYIFSNQFILNNFSKLIYQYKINICAFLMDQYIIAGIGNYIKNECLYLAKINPKRKTNTLNSKEIKKLYEAIKFVSYSNLVEQLEQYKLVISKDLGKLMPLNLEVPYNFKVYKQEYDINGFQVIAQIINGRNTYFVPEIQI